MALQRNNLLVYSDGKVNKISESDLVAADGFAGSFGFFIDLKTSSGFFEPNWLPDPDFGLDVSRTGGLSVWSRKHPGAEAAHIISYGSANDHAFLVVGASDAPKFSPGMILKVVDLPDANESTNNLTKNNGIYVLGDQPEIIGSECRLSLVKLDGNDRLSEAGWIKSGLVPGPAGQYANVFQVDVGILVMSLGNIYSSPDTSEVIPYGTWASRFIEGEFTSEQDLWLNWTSLSGGMGGTTGASGARGPTGPVGPIGATGPSSLQAAYDGGSTIFLQSNRDLIVAPNHPQNQAPTGPAGIVFVSDYSEVLLGSAGTTVASLGQLNIGWPGATGPNVMIGNPIYNGFLGDIHVDFNVIDVGVTGPTAVGNIQFEDGSSHIVFTGYTAPPFLLDLEGPLGTTGLGLVGSGWSLKATGAGINFVYNPSLAGQFDESQSEPDLRRYTFCYDATTTVLDFFNALNTLEYKPFGLDYTGPDINSVLRTDPNPVSVTFNSDQLVGTSWWDVVQYIRGINGEGPFIEFGLLDAYKTNQLGSRITLAPDQSIFFKGARGLTGAGFSGAQLSPHLGPRGIESVAGELLFSPEYGVTGPGAYFGLKPTRADGLNFGVYTYSGSDIWTRGQNISIEALSGDDAGSVNVIAPKGMNLVTGKYMGLGADAVGTRTNTIADVTPGTVLAPLFLTPKNSNFNRFNLVPADADASSGPASLKELFGVSYESAVSSGYATLNLGTTTADGNNGEFYLPGVDVTLQSVLPGQEGVDISLTFTSDIGATVGFTQDTSDNWNLWKYVYTYHAGETTVADFESDLQAFKDSNPGTPFFISATGPGPSTNVIAATGTMGSTGTRFLSSGAHSGRSTADLAVHTVLGMPVAVKFEEQVNLAEYIAKPVYLSTNPGYGSVYAPTGPGVRVYKLGILMEAGLSVEGSTAFGKVMWKPEYIIDNL